MYYYVIMVISIRVSEFTGHVLQAAFFYGLVVHFRIYPIIYSLPILLVLDPHIFQTGQTPALQKWSSRQQKQEQSSRSTKTFSLTFLCFLLKSFITKDRIIFGLVSGATFFFWTGIFFHLYGWEFLHEALLYHLTRTDPRHNFSIYFYHIYLHHQHGFSTVEKLISFLPQLLVQLVFTFCFAHDLPFCLFVQTVAFVAFNKVSYDIRNFVFLLFFWFYFYTHICGLCNEVGITTRTHSLLDSWSLWFIEVLITLSHSLAPWLDRLSRHSTLCGSSACCLWYCHGPPWRWNGKVCPALSYGLGLKCIGWHGDICLNSKARMFLLYCGLQAYCSWLPILLCW